MIVKGNGDAIGGDVHIGFKMGVAEADGMLERERSVFWMSAGTPAVSERKRVSGGEIRVRHGGSVAIGVDAPADGALTAASESYDSAIPNQIFRGFENKTSSNSNAGDQGDEQTRFSERVAALELEVSSI